MEALIIRSAIRHHDNAVGDILLDWLYTRRRQLVWPLPIQPAPKRPRMPHSFYSDELRRFARRHHLTLAVAFERVGGLDV